MGLRPLDDGAWIEIDQSLPEQLLHKRRLVEEHHGDVVATSDDHDGSIRRAAEELRGALAGHLVSRHPERYRYGSQTVPAISVGVVDVGAVSFGDGRHPIEHAGLLTQEDWCLHLPDPDGRWRLVAASVCFPTRWVLAEKIGRTVGAIHDPVPGYREHLEAPVDRFLDRLRPGRPMWRLNWNLVDRPELFQPTAGDPPDPPLGPADAGSRMWLRVERQTFVRLPASGAVVFGIRVHRDRLDSILGVPGAAARLLAAVRAMPEATRADKGFDRFGDAVTGWLERAVSPPAR